MAVASALIIKARLFNVFKYWIVKLPPFVGVLSPVVSGILSSLWTPHIDKGRYAIIRALDHIYNCTIKVTGEIRRRHTEMIAASMASRSIKT
jgi:hypothetical protein